MNLFRKQFLNLANRRFDVFSHQRFVDFQPRLTDSLRVGFARNLQAQFFAVPQIIFPLVKVVSRINKQFRHLRQVRSKFRQTLSSANTRPATRKTRLVCRPKSPAVAPAHRKNSDACSPSFSDIVHPAPGGSALCECCRRPPRETNQASSAIANKGFSNSRPTDETIDKSNPKAGSSAAKTATG